MPDPEVNPAEQTSVVMPNGVTLTGVGGDIDAIQESAEQRHQERTGQAVESTITDAKGEIVPETPKRERAPRGQKRFDQLTSEREAETARANAAEARARDLEAKLNAPKPTTEPAPAAQPTAEAKPTRPEPQESDIGVKYQSLSEYIRDLNAWGIEQNNAQLRAEFDARLKEGIEADRASRTLATTVNQAFTRGREQYPDFDAALKTVETISIPKALGDAIIALPNAEHVMYALAKDHTRLQKILAIHDPVLAGIEIAQVMPRPAAVAQTPASTPVAVRTTNAPAPPQPVGAGSRTAQPSLEELAASGNYGAYKARREAERKAG